MSMWTGLSFSKRRVVCYVALGLLVMGLNEWYARHVGRTSAEAERTSQVALDAAKKYRAGRQRYTAAAKAARQSVEKATVARRKVHVIDRQTLAVEGHDVPVLVPAEVTDLIVRQDTAVARLSIALLQADSTVAKADTALWAANAANHALRKRIPRFGFRTGVVVGAGLLLVAKILLR